MLSPACYKRSAATGRRLLCGYADADLMRLVSEDRDAAAFAVVYQRHAGAALLCAVRLCGTRGLAEDVVQEAFLSLWRSGERYDGSRGSLRAWVLGIVHHRAVDALRRGRLGGEKVVLLDETVADCLEAGERTDVEADRRAQAREVHAALRLLPPEQSRVVGLAYYGGLSHSEIAAMLGTPVGTIKGRMRLGLEKLRLQFAVPLGGGGGGGGRRIRSGGPWPPVIATPRARPAFRARPADVRSVRSA
jgi:RNA polymerase sigma-70 factor, ECF subfamily